MTAVYPFAVEAGELSDKRVPVTGGISEEAARQQFIAAIGGIPVGRTGKPAELAELVACLASERGAFISGVDYFLDGGAFPTV
jgi:NAD(P)-dependent dehydrogenase (short-subunit alcohol dehydrogenase family)